MNFNPIGFIETTLPVLLPGQWNNNSHQTDLLIKLHDGDQVLAESYPSPTLPNAPILIMLHGLTGSSKSNYIQAVGNKLNSSYHIVALNFRNAGRGVGLARKMYHSGLWQDLEDVVLYCSHIFPNKNIHIAGFSLGGNVLLKFLANSAYASKITSSVAISPPIQLERTVEHMATQCLGFFEKYFLSELKTIYQVIYPFLENKTALTTFPKTMQQFDHQFTAIQWGYSSATDYYTQCSSLPDLARITVPTTIIHAQNDPIVPLRPLTMVKNHKNLKLHISKFGGHVGFYREKPVAPQLPQFIERYLRPN